MQCTDALPDFIISHNGNMINLIGRALCRDEVKRATMSGAENGSTTKSGSTPMSEDPRPLPEESPVIVRLSIIVGFLLVLLVIVATRKP
jgi:hypothetical protein